MIELEKIIYTARTHTSGGRDGGFARSSDRHLEIKLSTPGGTANGTNPEQLFAAGWSACFISALRTAAHRAHVVLAGDVTVDAEVDLGPAGEGYALAARLNVNLPGVEHDVGRRLVEVAHGMCPYSRATRGNIAVATNLI